MKLPLEKVLTISFADYCAATGKKRNQFFLKGVHPKDFYDNSIHVEVPEGTEAVVNYRPEFPERYTIMVGSGTALIPKAKDRRDDAPKNEEKSLKELLDNSPAAVS